MANIRKRARPARSKLVDVREEESPAAKMIKPVTPATSVLRDELRKNKEVAVFRLRRDQVDKQVAADAKKERAFIEVLKVASLELQTHQMTGGKNGSTALSAAAVAAKHNVTKAVGADGSWALLARHITGALQLETAATAPAPVLALM